MDAKLVRKEFLGLAAAGFVLPGMTAEPAEAHTYRLPSYKLGKGHKQDIAWTVDDGYSTKSLAGYIALAKKTDLRFTFFVTPNAAGWLANKKALIPLVETGQVQLANHTQNHKDLRKLSAKQVRSELTQCDKFLRKHFGIDPGPYFRPPFGYYNTAVLAAAAEVGYTHAIMWEGSMGDAGEIRDSSIRRNVRTWMTGGRIFISHANNTRSLSEFDYIQKLLKQRKLTTKTLNDIYES